MLESKSMKKKLYQKKKLNLFHLKQNLKKKYHLFANLKILSGIGQLKNNKNGLEKK